MDFQPNKLAYITGSSKGIGKALCLKLLSHQYRVVGLSRSNDIEHPNFSHVAIDLNDLEAVKAFTFDGSANEVILINNAGIIGEIGPVGSIPNQTIQDVIQINTIAPQVLMNNFLKHYKSKVKQGHLFNISSGAGKQPIDAWASYCASKAALDLFSQTIREEWKLHGIKNWHIHSIAPGVVDTNMQVDIRKANPKQFKQVEKFIDLKNDGNLSDPEQTANLLYRVIVNPNYYADTIISVRDF